MQQIATLAIIKLRTRIEVLFANWKIYVLKQRNGKRKILNSFQTTRFFAQVVYYIFFLSFRRVMLNFHWQCINFAVISHLSPCRTRQQLLNALYMCRHLVPETLNISAGSEHSGVTITIINCLHCTHVHNTKIYFRSSCQLCRHKIQF